MHGQMQWVLHLQMRIYASDFELTSIAICKWTQKSQILCGLDKVWIKKASSEEEMPIFQIFCVVRLVSVKLFYEQVFSLCDITHLGASG